MKTLLTLSLLSLFASCSHSQMHGPHIYADGTETYAYEGRANFFWQKNTAKKMIQEKCDEILPGSKPVDKNTEEFSLGMVDITKPKASINCNISQADYFGRKTASCSESSSSGFQMDNRQMIVEFFCEK